MARLPAVTIMLAGALGLSGAASMQPNSQSLSEDALAALDPTRIARSICGQRADSALVKRLEQAAKYSAANGIGEAAMPLFPGIARSQIPATGLNGDAQLYFDQGMALIYGFNHKAAIRSFREARKLAPGCAMCWWAEAVANGPNINAGMDSEQNRAALAALKEAHGLMASASPLERELIEAQLQRYSAAPDADRGTLDAAYADTMLALAKRHPGNDDVAVLAAEAAMNTSPWNYWDESKTRPRPRMGEGIALLEQVIARSPRHPQASHLYIHLMENSTDPKIAEAAADRLAANAPAALGHLVHMPAHIYFRIGRYADSIDANIAAARADEAYLARVGDDGLYRFGYYPHNVHFLLTSAQMVGDLGTVATETARLARILDVETAKALPWVQAIHAAPAFALAQSGSPEAILALTAEPSELAYVEAMRHYARAIAHGRKGDRKAYEGELAIMADLQKSPGVTAMVDAGFPAPDLVALAILVARGKQAHFAGDFDTAVAFFEQAEAIERTIPYNEPPFWYYPIAQSRGAALYAAGRYREAKAAFMEALVQAPNDGWALYGLEQTEWKRGDRPAALATRKAFERVWRGDDRWLRMDRL